MAGLKVLVIGSGGREHALVWKIAQSPLVSEVHAAPGNPGMEGTATLHKVKVDDIDGLLALSEKLDTDLVVVGPELPLALGIVDRLMDGGRLAFGPCLRCARLETSKVFSKQMMQKAGVPTACARVFDMASDAALALKYMKGPVVVKLDGLAAGKGVVVAENSEEAEVALTRLEKMQPGGKVVLEEKLSGVETSLLCICDGEKAIPLVPARDYKRALDGDRGPNTGGMGAVAPSPFVGMDEAYELTKLAVIPILKTMAQEGHPYKGVLYAGLMLTDDGPKVLEYNCRFGDPETQSVLPLMEDDLVEVMLEAAEGNLKRDRIAFKNAASVTVVMASKGYPEMFDRGFGVQLADDTELEPGVVIFHAGTAKDKSGRLVTAGGRVLDVTAVAEDAAAATKKAYRAAGQVRCANLYYRGDIGERQSGGPHIRRT